MWYENISVIRRFLFLLSSVSSVLWHLRMIKTTMQSDWLPSILRAVSSSCLFFFSAFVISRGSLCCFFRFILHRFASGISSGKFAFISFNFSTVEKFSTRHYTIKQSEPKCFFCAWGSISLSLCRCCVLFCFVRISFRICISTLEFDSSYTNTQI